LNEITEIWKLYQYGKDYIDKMNMVTIANDSYRFYEGKHWEGLQSSGEKMPILEVIKPVVDYKIAVLNMNYLQAIFSPTNFTEDDVKQQINHEVCKQLNRFWLKSWETNNMDTKVSEALLNGIITGDSYMYAFYNDGKIKNGVRKPGKIEFEIIDNTNIMFADENESDIQKQEYVLIVFRRPLEKVKKLAEKYGCKESEIKKLTYDDNTDLKSGSRVEVDTKNKCTCVMKMWKENGYIHVSESTKNVVYRKDDNLKLTYYPVSRYLWEPIHGSCRGNSQVYKLIPNQIAINKMEAYRFIATKMCAFPKMVYSANLVNKEDVYSVGVALEVEESEITRALESIGYINAAPMSQDAQQLLSELMSYTKEASGASDIATGREKLDNATALLAIQEQAGTQMEIQQRRYKQFIEDISRILFDFWSTYFINGIQFIELDEMGNIVINNIPNSVIKSLDVDIRIDVTPTSPLNKQNEIQKADNLMVNQMITLEEYTSLIPEEEPMKPKLEAIVRKRQEQQQMMMQMQSQIDERDAIIQQQAQALDEGTNAYSELQGNMDKIATESYMRGAIESAASETEE